MILTSSCKLCESINCKSNNNNHLANGSNSKNCFNCEAVLQELDELYNELTNEGLDVNSILLDSSILTKYEPLGIMAASIYNMKKLDDIVVIYFSRVFYYNLKGYDNLSNVSCCFEQNPILVIFVEHFFRISDFDPTAALFSYDIYNWAITQDRFWQNEDIKKVFEQIQEELEKQNQK